MTTTIDLPIRRDIPLSEQCGHGKAWKETCRLCEIVSLEESLRWMRPQVLRDTARLDRLRREIADGYT
jgi:hypothetical protein